ncbi:MULTISPECIES: SOS response-associated peptidase [Halorussus]|uniref:SOS response-associated peptidase n=1 Tax=Halorussus TaxID=1070314 RepID=UPI0020A03318|nr:SOS response-associated peptidase [Halorussus vallis]USZ76196.1 SOS response-associated peptidase [Halorussus vallis]
MCGRTSLFVPQSVLEERFDATAVESITPRYNVAPGDDLATVRNDVVDEIDQFEWGLIPSWVDDPDDSPRPINARAETVVEKPMFREAFEQRRCLVLADGFYEWKGRRGSKQPYRITRRDDQPFAFAGLWETWEGPDGVRETATIVTTEANETVADVHDRMPVILDRADERTWLTATDETRLQSVLDPYPDDDLRAYPVSKRVNDPANDSPDIIEEIDIGEQVGFDEFGAS